MKNVFLSLYLMICALPTSAADWMLMVPVSYKSDLRFVDAESVVSKSGVVKVWIKVFSNPKIKPNEPWLKLQRLSFDCSDRTFTILESTSYKADDQSDHTLKNFGTNEIPPGSLSDRMREIVCTPEFPRGRQERNSRQLISIGDDIDRKATTMFDLMGH